MAGQWPEAEATAAQPHGMAERDGFGFTGELSERTVSRHRLMSSRPQGNWEDR